jgi:hypothetical protein
MQIKECFTNHPRSVGESYTEHMRVALSFAGPLAKAAAAALVHAFLPFLFVRTASLTVKSLNDRMARRCAACPKAALHRPDLVRRLPTMASVPTISSAAPDYAI